MKNNTVESIENLLNIKADFTETEISFIREMVIPSIIQPMNDRDGFDLNITQTYSWSKDKFIIDTRGSDNSYWINIVNDPGTEFSYAIWFLYKSLQKKIEAPYIPLWLDSIVVNPTNYYVSRLAI